MEKLKKKKKTTFNLGYLKLSMPSQIYFIKKILVSLKDPSFH